jgi:hypothetical protein
MVYTSIWDDAEFQALTSEAQRMYLMLISQSSITSVGVVPLALRRWTNSTNGMTLDVLLDALDELSEALYVVIDWNRDELLVRSFVRRDGGYKNPLRLKAVQRESLAVGSVPLAGVLAHELNRLGVTHAITASPIEALSKGPRSPIEGTSGSPIEDPSKGHRSPSSPSPVTNVTTGDGDGEGKLERGDPQPSRGPRGTRIPDDFAITDDMRKWATQNVPGMDIDLATKKFILHFQAASGQRATMVKWDAAWKKWMLGDYKPPQTNGRATDRRFFGKPGEGKSYY